MSRLHNSQAAEPRSHGACRSRQAVVVWRDALNCTSVPRRISAGAPDLAFGRSDSREARERGGSVVVREGAGGGMCRFDRTPAVHNLVCRAPRHSRLRLTARMLSSIGGWPRGAQVGALRSLRSRYICRDEGRADGRDYALTREAHGSGAGAPSSSAGVAELDWRQFLGDCAGDFASQFQRRIARLRRYTRHQRRPWMGSTRGRAYFAGDRHRSLRLGMRRRDPVEAAAWSLFRRISRAVRAIGGASRVRSGDR